MKVFVNLYNNKIGTNALFCTTLVLMASLLLNPAPVTRLAQAGFFALLCCLCQKKINFKVTLFTFFTILLFNMLLPYGYVLYDFGFLKITQGALLKGIERASTFSALILLSKFGLRANLKIPTLLGNLLAESLKLFSLIQINKETFSQKKWIESLDTLLFSLENPIPPADQSAPNYAIKTTVSGFIMLIGLVLMSGALAFY